MSRTASQLNIRSDIARRRVSELVRETGKTATQVVEDALRAYRPQLGADVSIPPGFEIKGRILVQMTERPTSIEEIKEAIAESRDYRADA